MFKHVLLPVTLLVLLLVSFGDAGAQDGFIRWLRYDVNLALQPDTTLVVEEVHQVALHRGATRYTRIIPTDRLVSISHIQILEVISGQGRRTYQQAETQAEYTFQILPASETEQTIVIYFPPNDMASTTFIIHYLVTGGLRFYPEGDRLSWRPFGLAAAAPIDLVMVTMKLPAEVPPEQLIQSSQGVPTEKFLLNVTQAGFKASDLSQGSALEVSLIFPHNLVPGSPPPWQFEADILEFWTPIFQVVSVGLALLILLLGTGGVYIWWYIRTHGKKNLLKKTPKRLNAPPEPLPPAIAGALLDGQAEPRHIMGALLDLANRGMLNIYPNDLPHEADKKSTHSFILYAMDQQKATAPYEATLYGKIFGYVDAQKRELAQVRQALFIATPELKAQITLEAIKLGYLSEGGGVARRQYSAFGGAGILISLVLTLLAGLAFSKYSYLIACPFLSLAVVAGIFTVTGFFMPKRAAVGAKRAAQWEAFRNYLKNLDRKSAAKAPQQFVNLLPYAVAFGVEKNFVEKFAAIEAPKPGWWSIPEEKLPDTSHEEAYAWVSSAVMSQAQPRTQKARAKSVIHRLGIPKQQGENKLLKDIKPVFMEFLGFGHDVFCKVYLEEENQKIDFEALEKQWSETRQV